MVSFFFERLARSGGDTHIYTYNYNYQCSVLCTMLFYFCDLIELGCDKRYCM